jgi:hypothetical protein
MEINNMTEKQIMQMFQELASSQGSYGRLLENLNNLKINNPTKFKDVMKVLTKYKTPVDLILAIEG